MSIIRSSKTGTFAGLSDTPDGYVGQAGKIPSVNDTESGLEFIPASFIPLWSKEVFTILPTETKTTIEAIGASFVKYFLLAIGTGNSYAFEMNVFDANGSPLDSITNKIGNMNISVVSLIGLDGPYLEITNNESYSVSITLTYMSN